MAVWNSEEEVLNTTEGGHTFEIGGEDIPG